MVSHFRTFGFVVFRGLLSGAEIDRLTDEATYALANAYGAAFDENTSGVAELPALDLPMMTGETPFATSLVADDPRFWQASHELLGTATVPGNGEVTCFLGANARWHADLPAAVTGVKFMVYLQKCSREAGQLQVLPGSHRPELGAMYADFLRQDPARQGLAPADFPVPAYGIDTEPGDVIAFHANLLHASVGGDRRMLWDVYYLPDPILRGHEERVLTRDALLHVGDYGGVAFDHDKWTAWRDWVSAAGESDARSTAVTRLRRLGVLDVPGADIGAPQWQPRLPKPSMTGTAGAPPMHRES